MKNHPTPGTPSTSSARPSILGRLKCALGLHAWKESHLHNLKSDDDGTLITLGWHNCTRCYHHKITCLVK